MGVDSGLPDFRGDKGFWKAYPEFKGKSFAEVASPINFEKDPISIWGFYGHRYNMYIEKQPHQGYEILVQLLQTKMSSFVYTSNVDGYWPRTLKNLSWPSSSIKCWIYEIHGSIHHVQCLNEFCDFGIQPFEDLGLVLEIDDECRLKSEVPQCDICGEVLRPNILMFGDYAWDSSRTEVQRDQYLDWLDSIQGQNIVAIELGAGVSVPSVRMECEKFPLIRINPRDTELDTALEVDERSVALQGGALEVLRELFPSLMT